VARRALKRGEDFDGRDDASVRVQAVRVRRHLEAYYAEEGADDPVRITLERGSYVPAFEAAARSTRPVVVVPGVVIVLLTASGDDPAAAFARSMSESLVQHLSAAGHIRVVGPVEAMSDASRAAEAATVSSVLTGHVAVRDGRLVLTVRLHDAATSEVTWSDDQSVDVTVLAGFEVERQWAQQIAARVGDPSGAVIRRQLATDRSATEPELEARLAFYAYLDAGTLESVEVAAAALDAALDSGRRTAQLLAMRAAIANTASVLGDETREVELARAEALAREALVRDGANAHAHLTLSYPLLQKGQVDTAIELIERAAELAPYQPFSLSTSGMALIACGEWSRGSALIREAFRLNPGLSGQTHGWLAFAHLAQQNYERALAEASLLPSEGDYLWGPLFRAMALSGLGYAEQAQAEATRARGIRPDVMDDPGAHFAGTFRLTDEELARLVALVPTTSPVPEQRSGDGSREPVDS
jgi:TolB-like protein